MNLHPKRSRIPMKCLTVLISIGVSPVAVAADRDAYGPGSFLLPEAAIAAAVIPLTKDDKLQHFAGGIAVSSFVTYQTRNPWLGCLAAFGVGLAKEAYDASGHGVVDSRDVWATGAGCVFAFRF